MSSFEPSNNDWRTPWNGDFIHRDHYTVAVDDQSYGKALESFAGSHGWNGVTERRKFKKSDYEKVDQLYVEALEPTIIDCTKEWSFADALACLQENESEIDWRKISKRFWERTKGSDVRVGQILKYGVDVMNRESGKSDGRGRTGRMGIRAIAAASQCVTCEWPQAGCAVARPTNACGCLPLTIIPPSDVQSPILELPICNAD